LPGFGNQRSVFHRWEEEEEKAPPHRRKFFFIGRGAICHRLGMDDGLARYLIKGRRDILVLE